MCKEVAKALSDAIENLQQMLEALEDKNPYAAQTFYEASKNANACIVRAVSDAVAPIRYSGEIQFKWPVRRAIVKPSGASPSDAHNRRTKACSTIRRKNIYHVTEKLQRGAT